jgi:DNA-directed RNA polymerase specialized sigma24 family protein
MGAQLEEIETLYRDSYLRYRNALATVTGSYDSARDAVQQAFAKAVAERSRFRGEGSLGAWVWKIALREARTACLLSRARVPVSVSRMTLSP